QRYTADYYLHLWILARECRISLPDPAEARVMSVLDCLAWMRRPDGTWPLVGDDDGGRLIALGSREASDFRDTLSTGAALLGSPSLKFAAGGTAAETLWLLGPCGVETCDQLPGETPRDHARAFGKSGYFIMRDGWSSDSGFVLLDCGPHG